MDLESKIKHCEVGNLPLNLSNKVGEGTSAIIYKFSLRNKDTATKCFRQQLYISIYTSKANISLTNEVPLSELLNISLYFSYHLSRQGFL